MRLGLELPRGSAPDDEGANALRVLRVMQGGMADAAGMKPGDVLVSIGEQPVTSRASLQVALRSAGPLRSQVTIRFGRDGSVVEASAPPIYAPMEEGVLYDAIECDDGTRLRAMIDPGSRTGAEIGTGTGSGRPAIVFLQGLATTSIELAFPDLFRGWRDAGVVTMRFERRGVGDSEGAPPEQTDLLTDVADARAAIRALVARRQRDFDVVDPDAVFVFGHSLGGMIAPMLDVDALVRGYLIYGSSARPWFDCLEGTARRQWILRGEETEESSKARAVSVREEMRAMPIMDGRPALYHRQLHDAEIAKAWSRVQRPVHVLHGEHDWVVGEEEARQIAELAAGGTFRSIKSVDHLFAVHASVEDSLRHYGKAGRFATEIVTATCAWMLGCAKRPT